MSNLVGDIINIVKKKTWVILRSCDSCQFNDNAKFERSKPDF